MSTTQQRILVFLIPLLLSLPFLNRAYFVDDHYFVEIAEWLVEHPDQPYDFRANDDGLQNRGWEENGFVRMVNPLAHHYFLSFLIRVGGASEYLLRLGCVLLVCFSGLILLSLAKRWTDHPLLASILVLATPVYALTAHSLLIDSTMGVFFLAGFLFFIHSQESNSWAASVLSGVFMGLAILSKYPAVFLFPLTACWLILNRKKFFHIKKAVVSWLLAGSFLVGYSLWTLHLYGDPHILAASQRMVGVFGWAKVLVFFVFLSGVTIVPLLFWWLCSKRLFIWTSVLILCGTTLFSSHVGGFNFIQAFLLSFWVGTSVVFFRILWEWRNKFKNSVDTFLVIWIVGYVFMMIIVMGWVAARYYVIVVPGIVFLTVRMVEKHWKNSSPLILKRMCVGVIGLTLILGFVDYKQAEPSRDVIGQLTQKGYAGGPGYYYLGDTFTMSYLGEQGWTPFFRGQEMNVGDRILSKEVTMPPIWAWSKGIQVQEIDKFEYPTWIPIKLMDYHGSAGFYASVWGALPFTVSTSPWETFRLYEVIGVKQ